MHVVVAGAPLSAPAGMVDGPRGAGHPVAVVAGVGGVVAPVGVVAVVVVAAEEQEPSEKESQMDPLALHSVLF